MTGSTTQIKGKMDSDPAMRDGMTNGKIPGFRNNREEILAAITGRDG